MSHVFKVVAFVLGISGVLSLESLVLASPPLQEAQSTASHDDRTSSVPGTEGDDETNPVPACYSVQPSVADCGTCPSAALCRLCCSRHARGNGQFDPGSPTYNSLFNNCMTGAPCGGVQPSGN